MWNRIWDWFVRHEPKVFYGLLMAFLVFFYLMGSIKCANYGNCLFANADLADWVFRFFGLK